MNYRAVLFDAAETLFTTRGSVGEIYASVARRFGSTAEPESIQAAFLKHFQGAGPLSVDDQKRWWKDVVFRVFSDVGMVRNFDAFFDLVYEQFRGSQGWMLFPETFEVLDQLHAAGVKLGIISNFDTRIYSVLESLEIRRFFDSVTTSAETGYSKPAPEIFRAAIRALDAPPEDVLLIGDSLRDDVEPAIRSGIDALLIDRHHRYTAEIGAPRISSLIEVVSKVTG